MMPNWPTDPRRWLLLGVVVTPVLLLAIALLAFAPHPTPAVRVVEVTRVVTQPAQVAPSLTPAPTNTLQPIAPTAPTVLTQTPVAVLCSATTAEQAVRDYYVLVGTEDYAAAYSFLSDEFNQAMGTTTLAVFQTAWQESGPAVVVDPMRVEQSGIETDTLLHLYYPKKDADAYLRFKMMCHLSLGDTRFGHWLLIHAAYADASATSPTIPDSTATPEPEPTRYVLPTAEPLPLETPTSIASPTDERHYLDALSSIYKNYSLDC